MHRLYTGILSLYPSAYRETFAAEMIDIHTCAAAGTRKEGPFALFSFSLRELAGLLRGLVSEWVALSAAPETYRNSCCSPTDNADPEIRLRNLIRCMEFAIAHHDFPKARYYSDQERQTRALLIDGKDS